MPDFRVEVDEETADALEVECDLLGFDGPEPYLAWIVDNRAAIEQGTESDELLAAYRERLVALEDRLAEAGVDPADVEAGERPARDGDTPPEHTGGTPETASDAPDEPDESVDESGESVDEFGGSVNGPGETPEPDPATAGTGPEPPTEIRGDDSGTDPAATGDRPAASDADRAASGGRTGAEADGATGTGADITSMHLRPERVQRVSEDPVAEDAGVLSDVETSRLDELTRRAVAETRRRLDRDVETGLDYDSSASIPGSTVAPGEDVTDLEAIEVPGRSADVVAERREEVGRALAFLRDEGRARRSDFVDTLYEDGTAGYGTADGWWRCVRGGLEQVDAVDGGHVWEYTR